MWYIFNDALYSNYIINWLWREKCWKVWIIVLIRSTIWRFHSFSLYHYLQTHSDELWNILKSYVHRKEIHFRWWYFRWDSGVCETSNIQWTFITHYPAILTLCHWNPFRITAPVGGRGWIPLAKGQWCGVLMFSLLLDWMTCWKFIWRQWINSL